MKEREPKELREFKRKMRNAQREIQKAVGKFAGIDALEGHRAEAVRQATEVRDAAQEGVKILGGYRRQGDDDA